MSDKKILIAITPFPGGVEYSCAKQDGTLVKCEIAGCMEQVLFRDEENNCWVCFKCGQLVLRRQWGDPRDTQVFLSATIQKVICHNG